MAPKSQSKVTTDHEEIRRWAEARRGKPTKVKGTGRGRGDVGMIRIDFPGYSGEGKLEPISWDEWFDKFDESGLALILQEKTARGQKSNFNKLVSRETIDARESGKGSRSSKSRSRRTTGRSQATRTTKRGSSSRKSAPKAGAKGASRSRAKSPKRR